VAIFRFEKNLKERIMKKTILYLATIFLISCGGESAPPFKYQDNSRIVLEGNLVDQNGSSLANQSAELYTFRSSVRISVKEVFSDNEGKIFVSAPKANYNYSLGFVNKNIISMQNYPALLQLDGNHPPYYYGFINGLNDTYYNFGIIKLINYN